MSIIYVDASALDDADRARVAAAIFAAVERPGLALIEEDVRALLDARNENDALRTENQRLREVLLEVRAWRRSAIGLEPQPRTDAETLGQRIDAALGEEVGDES